MNWLRRRARLEISRLASRCSFRDDTPGSKKWRGLNYLSSYPPNAATFRYVLNLHPCSQHHRSELKDKNDPRRRKQIAQTDRPSSRGSAIAKAKKFGVDLYGILENLKLTPAERF